MNAGRTVGKALDALADQDLGEPYEVIVVDDGSEDETVAIAERAPAPVTILRQDRLGPAAARNRGAAKARAGALAFLDADCFPTRSWLREGLAALRGADLVQGAVRPDPRPRTGPFDHTIGVGREGGLFEAANLLVRRDLFTRLGGFEDWLPARIGKPLAEDVWFGWRARRSGARTAFCERALAYHAVVPRGAREYVLERLRLVYFPAMAAKVPELRDDFFYRRWFLTRRSAAFDAALAGLAASVATSSALPLAAAGPYAWHVARRAVPWRRRAPAVAAADLLADAVGFGALALGSLRWRAPVL